MTISANKDELRVTSNVARDILQSAGIFKTLPPALWEYIVNSLQYVDQNVTPNVVIKVDAKKRTAEVIDNARGMDRAGLANYFTMHGHNMDRLAGNVGRGFFGTGKSAAFAVADTLVIRSAHNGNRNTVRLTRTAIEREAEKGNVTEVPIETLERDVPTTDPNGTTITIERIHGNIDVQDIMKFIERKISRGYKDAEVIVNGHLVEYEEPTYNEKRTFMPEGDLAASLGAVQLIVKVSPAPLDESTRGVDVMSNGNLFETTLGSVAGKEMSQYIFGEIDVPTLTNEGSGPTPAFTMSRDGHLNKDNQLVAAIHTFISVNVDAVRRELVEAEKKRKQSEDAKRLQTQASAIADMLNADFNDYNKKIEHVKQTVRGVSRDQAGDNRLEQGKDLAALIFGGDEEVEVVGEGGERGGEPTGTKGAGGDSEREQDPQIRRKECGDPLGRKITAVEGKKPARGGFNVEYRQMGAAHWRAEYDRTSRCIVINLDFPQLASALAEDGIESLTFKRLSNEVAFTEYAIAIAYELVSMQNYQDPSDYLFDVRTTINRLSRKAAELAQAA
jgi:hypothetical protein